MRLEGLHHITMITGDAQRAIDFYADVLGLRLVKATVNFDQPEAYHLYFGDEAGSPGSILTWFEFRGAAPGRAGLGMVHRIALAVPGEAALDFWERRLAAHEVPAVREGESLRFADRDGLALELVVHDIGAELRAAHPDVPAEHAITGVAGARAYGAFHAVPDGVLTDLLGFDHEGDGHYVLRGEQRHVHWTIDAAPDAHGQPGAGTVHHIAWASRDEDHAGWRQRIADGGGFVTEIIDRDYFDAIYFREPHGVLFEIATLGPGFATDEDAGHLGEELRLPKQHEHLRAQLDRQLTRIVNPRSGREVRA